MSSPMSHNTPTFLSGGFLSVGCTSTDLQVWNGLWCWLLLTEILWLALVIVQLFKGDHSDASRGPHWVGSVCPGLESWWGSHHPSLVLFGLECSPDLLYLLFSILLLLLLTDKKFALCRRVLTMDNDGILASPLQLSKLNPLMETVRCSCS